MAPSLPHKVSVIALARDGQPPSVTLSSDRAFQGGAFLVQVLRAVAGTVSFAGVPVPLFEGDDGSLRGYVGINAEAATGPHPVTITLTDLTGAVESVFRVLQVLPTKWTVDYIVLPPGVGSDIGPGDAEAELARLRGIYARQTPLVAGKRWYWPVSPSTPVTGYFGEQRSFNGEAPTGHHSGTDFGALAGAPAYTTNHGTVVLAERLKVRGNAVIVDHGGGVVSLYAHLSSIAVSPGQRVSAGQLVGYVGTTGLSTAPHLHWELAAHGVLVDGLRWLDGSQGFGLDDAAAAKEGFGSGATATAAATAAPTSTPTRTPTPTATATPRVTPTPTPGTHWSPGVATEVPPATPSPGTPAE